MIQELLSRETNKFKPLNLYLKAQLSLLRSTLSYGIKAFFIIFFLLFIFFSLSEITTFLVKSQNLKIKFSTFIKPSILIMPTFLSAALPYVFIITIFLLIFRFNQIGFFQYRSIFNPKVKYLFLMGMVTAFTLSIFIYFLHDNLLKKFDKHIEKEIHNVKNHSLNIEIEPFSFTFFGQYVFYFPMITKKNPEINGQWGHVYQVNKNRITFFGRGYLIQGKKAGLFLKDTWGMHLFSNGRVQKLTNKKRITLIPKYIKHKTIRKYIENFKTFFSVPSIPLTDRGHKYGYPFSERLKLIKKLQFWMYHISPVCIFLFIFFVYFKQDKYLDNKKIIFQQVVLFSWCIFYLLLPMFTKVDYYSKPSFFWFWMVIILTIITSVLTFKTDEFLKLIRVFANKINTINTFFHKTNELKRNSNSRKHIFRYEISPFTWAKIKVFIKLFKSFLLWIFSIHILIFLFIFFYNIFINWKLNHGMEYLLNFIILQLYYIPEKVLSLSPFILIFIIPVLFFHLQISNFLNRIELSCSNPNKIIRGIIITGVLVLFFSLFIREFYALELFKKGWMFHQEVILRRKSPKNLRFLSNRDFITLPNNKVLFYSKAILRSNNYVLYDVMIDDIESNNIIYIAKRGYLNEINLDLKNGYEYKIKNRLKYGISNALGSDLMMTEFLSKKIPIASNFHDFINVGGQIPFMNIFSLRRNLEYRKSLGGRSYQYIKGYYMQRVIPFLMFIAISAMYGVFIYFYKPRFNNLITVISIFLGLGILIAATSMVIYIYKFS